HGDLQVLIQDNGIGISSEDIKHVFEKFYRAPDQYKMQSKGLGLGLYYVRKIIDAHGWSIRVDSKPSKGSQFIITIP
ncbi:ATP-binding protein, partial [Escherichia coli]|nr:ATP-binding protein [Escherichia coli]